jgi:type I site-specific restriction-modification system R (restriction) subunit
VLVDESHRTQSGKKGGHGQFALKIRPQTNAAIAY